MKYACSALTGIPSRAIRAAGAPSSASGMLPKRSTASTRPAGTPGTPHEAAPMWKTCEFSSVKWTGIGTSSAPRVVPSVPPTATKKSSRTDSVALVDEHVAAGPEARERALGDA